MSGSGSLDGAGRDEELLDPRALALLDNWCDAVRDALDGDEVAYPGARDRVPAWMVLLAACSLLRRTEAAYLQAGALDQIVRALPRLETLAADVREFELSADGRRMMVVRSAGGPGGAPEILLVEAGARLPGETARFQVRWADWSIATDPKAEWRQMFADAWRMQREHFYDRDMHGVDWVAVRRRHEPLVERVTDRLELAELLAQMVSHLGALHSQVSAPDLRSGPEEPALASLAAELTRVEAGWRIQRILRGDPELPTEASPLGAPGLEIAEGDVITAINGRAASGAADPAELLRGQAGRQVLLALRKADGRSTQAVVVPASLARERQLRLLDWRQSRLRSALESSQGRIGYLHLRAMGREDIADFAR